MLQKLKYIKIKKFVINTIKLFDMTKLNCYVTFKAECVNKSYTLIIIYIRQLRQIFTVYKEFFKSVYKILYTILYFKV